MSAVQIATPFNLSLDFEIAEFHKRIFAYLVDLVILVSYGWIMGNIVEALFTPSFANRFGGEGWALLIVSLPMLLYPVLCEVAMHGQTVGKRVFDIRVMNLSGGEPSLSQYVIRWIFRMFEWPLVFGVVVPGLQIIYQLLFMIIPCGTVLVIIAVTRKNQRLGDLAANTVLVKTRINTSIQDTIFQTVDEANYEVRFPQVMRLTDRDINTIKAVLNNAHTKGGRELAVRTANRVTSALQIETNLEPVPFMETLMQDYNYMATRE